MTILKFEMFLSLYILYFQTTKVRLSKGLVIKILNLDDVYSIVLIYKDSEDLKKQLRMELDKLC